MAATSVAAIRPKGPLRDPSFSGGLGARKGRASRRALADRFEAAAFGILAFGVLVEIGSFGSEAIGSGCARRR